MRYAIAFLLLSISSAVAQQGQAVGPYISPTAPNFSTSVTSPLQIGGSAASSTLTLESTSGAGTTDAVIFQTASQVERARIVTGGFFNVGPNVAPDALLTVNGNTAATVSPGTGPLLHLIGADGAVPRMIVDAFGVQNVFLFRYSDGTLGSKTAVGAGKTTQSFANSTWDGSAYTNNSQIDFLTVNAQSVSDHSSTIRFSTTPTGSVTQALAMSVQASGGVAIGNIGTDPGIGSLQVNANIFAPNLPTTAAALGAAVCWTATTGQFQRDTNAGGCLVSSERYKHDVRPLTSSLADVMAMRPVSFLYNDDVGVPGQQVGFIAEQMASADPLLVGFNSDGEAQSVRYMQLTARLAGAIQELKADNDALRTCQQSWKCRVLGISP